MIPFNVSDIKDQMTRNNCKLNEIHWTIYVNRLMVPVKIECYISNAVNN